MIPMKPLIRSQQHEFINAKKCWICNKNIGGKNKKVRDHNHYTDTNQAAYSFIYFIN